MNTTSTVSQIEFESLIQDGGVKAVTVTGANEGWHVMARTARRNCALGAKRGHLRAFRTLETAVGYLAGLGVERFEVDASSFDPAAFRAKRQRPDKAITLREAHAAAVHDRWFRGQVQIGLEQADGGGLVPHEEVMADSQRQREKIRARIGRSSK